MVLYYLSVLSMLYLQLITCLNVRNIVEREFKFETRCSAHHLLSFSKRTNCPIDYFRQTDLHNNRQFSKIFCMHSLDWLLDSNYLNATLLCTTDAFLSS